MSHPGLSSFTSAANGFIPTEAAGAQIRFGGMQIPPARAADAGALFGDWINTGNASPVNGIVALSQDSGLVTTIAPGGRPRSEIPSELLQGRKQYKAQPDMFGPPVEPPPAPRGRGVAPG